MFTIRNHEDVVIGWAKEPERPITKIVFNVEQAGVVATIWRGDTVIFDCGYPYKHVRKGDTFTFVLAAATV